MKMLSDLQQLQKVNWIAVKELWKSLQKKKKTILMKVMKKMKNMRMKEKRCANATDVGKEVIWPEIASIRFSDRSYQKGSIGHG